MPTKNKVATIPKYEMPTLEQLYSDKQGMVRQSQLNVILNSEPKKEWVKIHPMSKVPYIGIDRIEYLLTMIFGGFNVEIRDTKLIANSVVVTVRVHVKNPVTGLPEFQDGIGAVAIQIRKDSGGATDFANMNSNAIQIGAPAAESYAFKDAVEKWGKIFGKDVGRKDNIQYVDRIHAMISSLSRADLAKEVVEEVEACTTTAELKAVYDRHKGLGKAFDKLVADQGDFIREANQDDNGNA